MKKQPAKKRPSKTRGRYRTVKVKRFVGRYQLKDVEQGASFHAWSTPCSPRDIEITITLRIPLPAARSRR